MLSHIWNATTTKRSDGQVVMELAGFALALRMIAVAQSPAHRTQQFSKTAIMGLIDGLPLPTFTGGATAPASAQEVITVQPDAAPNTTNPVASAGVAGVAGVASGDANVWSINENQFRQYEAFFAKADLDRDGYASMSEAVVFFKQSKLDKSVLASIWKLSDADGDKRLSVEEFVVAMHLIMVHNTQYTMHTHTHTLSCSLHLCLVV